MRLTILLTLCLTACGPFYRSSSVAPGVSDGTNVRVIALNAETVSQANCAPFAPKTLPAVFSLTAGAGGIPRGAGALPEAPSSQNASRGELALRLPPAVMPQPYRIGVADVLLLATPAARSTVEELSGLLAAQNSRQGYTVQDDGSINIPDIGRIKLAGMTVDEAQAELFRNLVANQIDPTFSLEIAEFNSGRVAIGGAVGQPTVVPVTLSPLTLGEALAAAGSVSAPDLDISSVRIYRAGEVYQIPLADLYARGDLQNLPLLAGDSVFVDTEFALDRAETYFEQQIRLSQTRIEGRAQALDELRTQVDLRRADLTEARNNFETQMMLDSVDRDYVYLTGELGKQSRFALPFERRANLADALFDAGEGIDQRTGDVSQVYVLRAGQDPREFAAVTAWQLDARNAANFVLATRFELRPEDVIFIAQQPVTKWNRVITQITPSLITTTVAGAVN